MKMANRWNRFIYRLWAPIYDATINHFFLPGRKRAIEILALRENEQVLLVGAGTGADFPLLPKSIHAHGLDLSHAMLRQARRKIPLIQSDVKLVHGDALKLPFAPGSFDAAVLNLILSVVPDAHACLQGALETLKPGGRVVIFDKFLPDDQGISLIRKLINVFSSLLGTDITRRLGSILACCPCRITAQEASLMEGTYQIILLQKTC